MRVIVAILAVAALAIVGLYILEVVVVWLELDRWLRVAIGALWGGCAFAAGYITVEIMRGLR